MSPRVPSPRPAARSSRAAAPRRSADGPADFGAALAALADLVGAGAQFRSAGPTPPAVSRAEPVFVGRADNGTDPGRLAEARYRALIEQIPAVTFLASIAGGRSEIYVSPQIESLIGFTQEEWISDPILWWRQTHPADRDRVSLAFAASCATGQPFRDEFRVIAKNGDTVWVHAESRLVRDEEGRPLFLQGVGFDVTEQHRAQEAREQLIREQAARAEAETERERREEFLAAAAHDLKTPLTAIQGLIQLTERRVVRGTLSQEDLSSTLTQVRRSARRMTSLLDELLDVTRLQMDRPLSLNQQVTDLGALVATVIEDHRGVSERHEVVFQPPASPIVGLWDPARLDRVVSNLVTNAIKYSPEGRRVTVRLHRAGTPDGERATLEVEDQGIGIPAGDLPHIFDRFHRAGNVGHLRGTGIGLAYVNQVVEEHGGTIEVRSQVGAGSTFVVHLPIQDVTAR